MDPGSTPGHPKDTHAQLVAEGGFPRILVGRDAFPFVAVPFWVTQKSVQSTVMRQLLRLSPFFNY
jgi:hypothetical protein